MGFIVGALKVIFLLGFLVFIHEGGHFLVAKLCKVKVREFSLGFGPNLFSKQGVETKYSIRAIPFGGYVDMVGETEQVEEKGSFSEAKVLQRIAIVVAGAVVNIVFGLVAYFLLMSLAGMNSSTVVKQIIPEYASETMALQVGDKITRINDKKTRIKSDIDMVLFQSKGENLSVWIERNGENMQLSIAPTEVKVRRNNALCFGGRSRTGREKLQK